MASQSTGISSCWQILGRWGGGIRERGEGGENGNDFFNTVCPRWVLKNHIIKQVIPLRFPLDPGTGGGNGRTAFFSPKLSSWNKYLFQPTPICSSSPPPSPLAWEPAAEWKTVAEKNIFRVCSLSRKPQREMGKIEPNKSSAGRKALEPRKGHSGAQGGGRLGEVGG